MTDKLQEIMEIYAEYDVKMIDYRQGYWAKSFDGTAWERAPEGSLIYGFYRSDCRDLHCIEFALFGKGNWGEPQNTISYNWW